MANTTTPKDENLYSIKSWLWHSVVRPAKNTMHSTVLEAHTLTPERKEEENLL